MADIIDSVQLDTPGSALIDLFEIELSASTLYFHSGLEGGTEPLYFPNLEGTEVNKYIAIPIDISGIEASADGALSRPTLTVANIVNGSTIAWEDAPNPSANDTTLKNELRGLNELSNEFFLGKRLVRRRTLKEHLVSSGTTPAIPDEMPVASFIIDRIAAENNTLVSFELASPLDVEGVVIPNRMVVGKYCSWQYQGHFSTPSRGGCNWKLANEHITSNSSGNGWTVHQVFFDQYDRPGIKSNVATIAWDGTHSLNDLVRYDGMKWRSNINGNTSTPSLTNTQWQVLVEWANYSATTYSYSPPPHLNAVQYNDKLWVPKRDVPSDETPYEGSYYWARIDLCGKTVNSCKIRFQYTPIDESKSGINTVANAEMNTDKPLPFGGYPGTLKFK